MRKHDETITSNVISDRGVYSIKLYTFRYYVISKILLIFANRENIFSTQNWTLLFNAFLFIFTDMFPELVK